MNLTGSNSHEIENRQLSIGNVLAERVGFEPTERFPVHSISSAANSTTLAPLLHCQFPIAHCRLVSRRAYQLCKQRPIGNRHLEIGNVVAERVGFEPTVGVY